MATAAGARIPRMFEYGLDLILDALEQRRDAACTARRRRVSRWCGERARSSASNSRARKPALPLAWTKSAVDESDGEA
jgi:hypothetical protein